MKFNINKLIKDYQKITGKDDGVVSKELFPTFNQKHARETLLLLKNGGRKLTVDFIIHCLELFEVSPNKAFGYDESWSVIVKGKRNFLS